MPHNYTTHTFFSPQIPFMRGKPSSVKEADAATGGGRHIYIEEIFFSTYK